MWRCSDLNLGAYFAHLITPFPFGNHQSALCVYEAVSVCFVGLFICFLDMFVFSTLRFMHFIVVYLS